MAKEVVLLFENVKNQLDDARNCLNALVPCRATRTADNNGLYIKKTFTDTDEYNKIMDIKKKYNLKEKENFDAE